MTIGDLPSWLIDGVLLGLVAAAGVLGVYLIGMRWFDLGQPARDQYDPDGLRRAEVRAYLIAIGETAVESLEIGGIPTDFWLPKRQVAITFDADAYFRLRDAGVTAVLLEHEVPGDRIGPRLPFETPSLSGSSGQTPGDRWAYETLRVSTGATEEAIDRAYRARIKAVHPDQGGDADELIAVIRAYEHLSNAG